ncbi:hypothetical protein DY000_02039661 [Brassica cretica]|uniref:Uncharacterized protein n=1 Tax=Brassica cretica TaxID=69181 RepID=A0ABQ7B7Y2_BRACR|nr:hypothetical protein DY000_02039661 [Brassica cretica]
MTHSFLERIDQPGVDLANDREESVPFNVLDATFILKFSSSQMFSMLFRDSLGNGVSYGVIRGVSKHCDPKRDEEWRLINQKAIHAGSSTPSPLTRVTRRPTQRSHAGSTTRSHELEESSRSDAGKATRVIPIFPTRVTKDFVRGVTRVKQRGITRSLARRRSIVEGPTRGG